MTESAHPDRRHLLFAGGALATLATGAVAAPKPPIRPAPLPIAAQPLPFDPATLGWLSDRLITSHHANNYTGAVTRLGAIKTQFAATDVAIAPGFVINGLKREELIAWNSMILHEIYFAGLGAPAAASAPLAAAIERDFGSLARWAAEFTAMGKALGGGSGWVLLTWSPREQRLANQWAADHTMTLAGATPVLALDMYEHAYALDFGAKAAAYVDRFMKNINWTHANTVFAQAAG
jgi:Fe-Mn family superoxide dismutase